MPDIDSLKTFVAVHSLRSFSRAAERLNRTQPAISARIRLLERELDVPLFERTSQGVRLSAAGQALLPHAESVLAAVHDAENAVRAVREGTGGGVSLAIVGTLAGPRLTRSLERFAAECPAVDVSLQTARSVDVGTLVRRGDATIGIRYHREEGGDLEWMTIGEEPLLVACAPRHEKAGRRVASLAVLRNERWIAFPESAGQRETSATHVFGLFLAHGFGPVQWLPVDSLTAQKSLVEGGFGVALMPQANIREELARGTIRTITVAKLAAKMPIFAVTRVKGFLSPAASRLRELLASEYGREAASKRRRAT